mgnify:CR=1 FL=1
MKESDQVTRETFLRHYMEVERPLRAYLWCATRDRHATDDLLQNVWQALWTKLDQYDPARPFVAWAMGMARFEVLRWRQRHARSKEVLSPRALELLAVTAEEHADTLDDLQHHLEICLEKLPGRSRKVLHLFYFERLRIAEMARRLGRTVGALEMHLVRLRRQLRTCMETRMARERRS